MEDKVAWFVRKGPFADRPEDMGGDYNGYVIVGKTNPYFGKSYNDVDISIHGGWTYSANGDGPDWEEISEEYRTCDYYIFGWDTLHSGDSRAKWPKEKVEKVTERAAAEFRLAQLKNIRRREE